MSLGNPRAGTPQVPPMKILDGAPRIKMWGISENRYEELWEMDAGWKMDQHGPFLDVFFHKRCEFPWLCEVTGGYWMNRSWMDYISPLKIAMAVPH